MDSTNQDKRLFCEAQEYPPDQRGAFLKRACQGDDRLLQRVQALLDAYEDAGRILNPDMVNGETLQVGNPFTDSPGTLIGRYRILEEIGAGGFGVVYMAEQMEPVHRKVALKIIKAGMDSREVVARFEAERQALALMDHPNIARVFDGGATPAGRSYFVMELVRGIRITDYCDRHNLPTGERLELFIQVCRAVQHAHQKGIIHRDLKPSNILVTTPDGVPVPKVIDFGIAKATAQRLTDKTLFTGFAQFIGTPAYISPEQAEITALDVDTRSDIYSLGVLLYELLTGQTPFDADQLVKGGMDAMRRIIREDEPPRPSTRLSTLAADALTDIAKHRHAEPPRLIHSVRGDLDWIVMKCLEKDRRRRYESAGGLAVDVERHLRAEPVEAVPPSLGYRIQKLAKRNRKSLAAAAVVLAAIMVTAASVGWVVRDRQARQAVFEQRVVVSLDETRKAYLREDLTEARAAVRSAEALLATASAGEGVADAVRRWRTDLDMVERLETIHENSLVAIIQSRGQIAGLGDDRAIARETDQAYRDAFDQYGLPLEEMSDEQAAERMSGSLIKDHLVVALDHWVLMKWIQNIAGTGRLHGIAQRVNSDPWRERVRAAMLQGRKGELLKLAGEPDIMNSTPLFMKMFAAVLDDAGEPAQAINLLQLAQQSAPDNYWINFLLSFLLWNMRDYERGIQFGRTAVALRPDAWAAHGTLAHNLALSPTLRDQEAAEFHWRQAIRLNPEQPFHYVMLADTLSRQHRNHGKAVDADEMDALYEMHLKLMPAEYEQAITRRPEDHWPWFQAAALHLHNGDVEAYHRCCAGMLKHFGQTDDAVIAERTAKTCLLKQDAVKDLLLLSRLSEVAVSGAEEHEDYSWFVMVRALASYRASRYEAAAVWLERSHPPTAVSLATFESIRAMTLHRLGRTSEAGQSLTHADTLIGEHPFRDLEGALYELYDWVRVRVLFQEAASLLGRQDVEATPSHEGSAFSEGNNEHALLTGPEGDR